MLSKSPGQWAESGIQALALDFDGVLAPHGADQPLPETLDWLDQAVVIFGSDKLVILSNRAYGPRLNWFAKRLPGVRFVSGVRKKPYPDGINKAGELMTVPLSSILMIDDRLLTGCLAAIIAGARPCYVRSPYSDTKANLLPELFFTLLRSCERLLVRLLY